MDPNGIEGLDAQFVGLVSPTAPRIQAGGHPCQGIYWTLAGQRPKVAVIAGRKPNPGADEAFVGARIEPVDAPAIERGTTPIGTVSSLRSEGPTDASWLRSWSDRRSRHP
mgnify:CR=1 FL=1